MNLKELAAKVVAELKDGTEILDGVKAVKAAWGSESNVFKKSFKAVSAAVEVISDVVERVERVGADLKLAGDKKKELAVEVVNSLIDIPYVPEAAEAVMIELVIDTVVRTLNRRLGKDWLGKIA